MLLFKNIRELLTQAHRPHEGWIITEDKNAYIKHYHTFTWPWLTEKEIEDGTNTTGAIFLMWKGDIVKPIVYRLDTEMDIWSESQVGSNPEPVPDTAFVDDEFAVVLIDGRIEYYTGGDGDAVTDAIANVYFNEDETIMTLAQFKAQPTYVKKSYFLQEGSKHGIDYIKFS